MNLQQAVKFRWLSINRKKVQDQNQVQDQVQNHAPCGRSPHTQW